MTDELSRIMDRVPTRTTLSYGSAEKVDDKAWDPNFPKYKEVVAVFDFSKQGFGFGEIVIVTGADGQTYIDAETMDKATVMEMLKTLVDSAILDSDDDPEKHRLYDEFMSRRYDECQGDIDESV